MCAENSVDLFQQTGELDWLAFVFVAAGCQALLRSPAMAWAVSAMIGMWRVSGEDFNWRVACHPSMTGKLMSMRIRSGFSVCAFSTPCIPSIARVTSNPRRISRLDSISRFISLSSTSKIFGIDCSPYTTFKSLLVPQKARLSTVVSDNTGPSAPVSGESRRPFIE
jgi:hypothetical protein